MTEQTRSILPVLYRAVEVASMLKISRSMAYRLIQMGMIPSVRINHSVRVRQSDLEEFVQKNWSGWINNQSQSPHQG